MIGKTGGTANTVSRKLAPQVHSSSNAAHGFGALFIDGYRINFSDGDDQVRSNIHIMAGNFSACC
jgi:hypothetical protein